MGEVKELPVNMGEHRGKTEKMSYEQLENIAHQLSDQNRQLHADLLKSQETAFFKRLDYLFKVLENYSHFPVTFIDKCVKETVDIMTIPENLPIEEAPNKD